MKPPLFIKRTITFLVSSLALSMTLSAVDVNLMDQDFTTNSGTVFQSTLPGAGPDQRMGFINDALYRRTESTDDVGSGSGVFRNLYKVQDTPAEAGYNRNGALDASVPGGFDPFVSKGQLATDASGSYYVFTMDVNEANNSNRYVSLDTFEIYAGGTGTDLNSDGDFRDNNEVAEAWGTNPLPQTVASLASYTTLIYDMDAGTNSTVFIDYSSSNGSGTFDLFVFVPVSMFDAVSNSTMIYIYTEFGGYTNGSSLTFSADTGGEEIAAYTGVFLGTITTNIPIPEPSTSLLSGLGVLMLLCRRSRA